MAEIRALSLRLLDFVGMVTVTDGEKAIQARRGMHLYKNHTVGCGPESYAAIDDGAKACWKINENSAIRIDLVDNRLVGAVTAGTIEDVPVNSAGDESLNIRTSTMALGVRG